MFSKALIGFISVVFIIGFPAHSVELEGHKFSETEKIGDVELKLNGVGLRKVNRYGLSFDVYVAGLYLQTQSTDPKQILNSDEIKLFKSYYLRRVEVKDQRKAWKRSMRENCFADCTKSKDMLSDFIALIKRTKDGGKFDLTFYPDRVEFSMEGDHGPSSGTLKGAHFSKDLLAVFLGEDPPTKALKDGLLGEGMSWVKSAKPAKKEKPKAK